MGKLDFYDREDRPWPNPRLRNGAIVGHTTTSTARLWLRVSVPGEYWLLVARAPIPTDGVPSVVKQGRRLELALDSGARLALLRSSRKQRLDFDTDLTAVFDLKQLVIPEQGALDPSGPAFKKNPIRFRRLQVTHRNNFGIMRVSSRSGAPALSWDLYGSSERDKEISKLQRIEL